VYLQPLTSNASAITNLRLHPVLLEKGGTKVALYGLGYIRGERLARAFQTPDCVEWCAPDPAPPIPGGPD
jgi:double-strand break repair protein MRE11